MVKREPARGRAAATAAEQVRTPVTSSLWSSATPPSYKTNPEPMSITILTPCYLCRLPGLCPLGDNAKVS